MIETPKVVIYSTGEWAKLVPELQILATTNAINSGKKIIVRNIPNISFSNISQMFILFQKDREILEVLLKSKNLTETEITSLTSSFEVLTEIVNKHCSNPHGLLYPVPNDYSLEAKYEIKDTTTNKYIRQTRIGGYRLGLNDFKRIFNMYYDVCIAKTERIFDQHRSLAYNDGKRITINTDSDAIRIGCQQIDKIDIEQLALSLGFVGEKFTVSDWRN